MISGRLATRLMPTIYKEQNERPRALGPPTMRYLSCPFRPIVYVHLQTRTRSDFFQGFFDYAVNIVQFLQSNDIGRQDIHDVAQRP